jgi:hypothetical protein
LLINVYMLIAKFRLQAPPVLGLLAPFPPRLGGGAYLDFQHNVFPQTLPECPQ